MPGKVGLACVRQEASVSLYVGFSMGLFECLYNLKAGFPLRDGCKRARQRLYPSDDVSSHIASHFCYILWLEGNKKKKKKKGISKSNPHSWGGEERTVKEFADLF